MNDNEETAELYRAAILIVDDDALSRKFAENALRKRGFQHVLAVENGVKALAQLESNLFDLVILDICMKGWNGMDCCEWIRKQPKLRELPVLMLTSLTDQKMRCQAFKIGATDFVSKPLHPDELFARVKVHLENRLAIKHLRRYQERLQLELSSASELQASVLPSRAEIEEMQTRCHLQIASHLSTSSEIGGDFWGMKQLMPQQPAFWMVDFSGHGVAAALNAFRMQAYLKENYDMAARPGAYLSHLNDKLLNLLLRGYFATMFYGIVDTSGNRLHYACACAPHPLILRKDGTVDKIDGTGTPLGICMQFYETHSIVFQPGDTLLLYSDALIETPDKQGVFLSEDSIMQLLSDSRQDSAERIRETILHRFQEHSAGRIADDLTLAVIRRAD